MEMKKFIALILALAACLSLCSCGASGNGGEKDSKDTNSDSVVVEKQEGEEAVDESSDVAVTPLALDTAYEVEDCCELTLVRIATTDKVEGTMGGSIYYENGSDGETYIDVVFDITNTSAEAVSSEDLMDVVAVSDSGKEYNRVMYCVETNEMTYVEQYEDLAPLAKNRFHAAISVPEAEKKLTLKFLVGNEVFSYEYETNVDVKTTIDLSMGDVIGNEDYATAEFLGYEFTEAVYPSNTSGYYRYYEVENSDNIYLAMKFKITNYQANSKDIDTFISGKATFAEKYKYTGFVASEDADGAGLSNYNEIAPLQTAIVYCMIEVPKAVSEQSFSASVMFDKQEYSFGK